MEFGLYATAEMTLYYVQLVGKLWALVGKMTSPVYM